MNLKDAFRLQNKIKSLMDEAEGILTCRENVMEVKKTLLKKKVMPDAENETTIEEARSVYADKITEMVDFLMMLMAEHERLAGAVRRAKNVCGMDLDSEMSLNAKRQQLARTMRCMADLRSSEKLIPDGGTGYRFNQEGNQVAYRCDLKCVSTIHFDRNAVRRHAVALSKKADEISERMDHCLIETPVEYQPVFDVNDSFSEIFERYVESRGA